MVAVYIEDEIRSISTKSISKSEIQYLEKGKQEKYYLLFLFIQDKTGSMKNNKSLAFVRCTSVTSNS